MIQNLHFKEEVDGKLEDRYLIGSSNPGIPQILIGRTPDISWGITAAITDNSDIYRETISEDGSAFKIDGEWRKLKEEHHAIKVKGEQDELFTIKHTHRGPVLSASLIKNAQVLFASKLPVYEDFGSFSLAWAGHFPGESLFTALKKMRTSKTLLEL